MISLLAAALGSRRSTTLPAGLAFRADVRAPELHALLASSYVATDDGALRIAYSEAQLRWLLEYPNGLFCAISEGDGTLVAFVCALPGALRVRGRPTPLAAAEVSLLSVKHSWRGRGLTPLLLGELRSRAAARGLRRAVYTAAQGAGGAPLACAGCFHRPLRPRALLRRGFWQLPDKAAVRAAVAAASLAPARAKWRPPPRTRWMRPADAAACRALLDARAGGFAVGPALDDAAFRHRFLGGGARSLVVLDRRKKPCAFVSFAVVALRDGAGRAVAQAQLLGFAAAPFAAAADGAPPAPEALLVAALLRARRLGAHVFTAPALAEHTPRLLESLGFFAGDGATHLEIHDAAAADGEAAAGEDALPSDLKAEEVAWLPFL